MDIFGGTGTTEQVALENSQRRVHQKRAVPGSSPMANRPPVRKPDFCS
jgi:hypothetical protein